MKKILALFMAVSMMATATACGSQSSASSGASAAASSSAASSEAASSGAASGSGYKIAMVTDTGGVNDQSFNQSSWEGLQQLKKDTGADVSYLESKQASDYATNLDNLADNGNKLIWGIGYAMADALSNAAKENPDISYAIVDNGYDPKMPSNVTGVMFRAQESSFLVGYIAGKTTKTNKVGFVGGMTSAIIDQFQYGYQAGVDYAAKELNKKISVSSQYAQSYSDAAKGKAIASKMFADGCDIVFHAAGGTGTGVIEAAKEANKFAIGVDRDQAYLAPKNVLTSALKLAGKAVEDVSKEAMSGKKIGAKTYTFGLKEGAIGIPTENQNLDKVVYEAAMKIQQKIIDGSVVPPYNKDTYQKFKP